MSSPAYHLTPPPVLDLSGPALRHGLESLADAAEPAGGITAFLDGLVIKAGLFAELLGGGRVRALDQVQFLGLCNFMPTVRRRVGPWLDVHGYALLHTRLVPLMDGPGAPDARMASFIAAFPADRPHRWVRDLAAEMLHFTAPDQIPLMTRWVWDAGIGTGMLREIWYSAPGMSDQPDITDGLATFQVLHEEITGFLREHGMFRDLALMQDLLCAHIYAGYINDRGGTYLKGDFAGGEDPMGHTRRLLGLDALVAEGLRPRVKLPDSLARDPALRLVLQEEPPHADS